jgi:hypothetical protein
LTISSETRKAGPYTGNGTNTSFPFSFKVFQASDVVVVRTDLSGVETTLTLGTDYTVTVNANQNSNPGGSITTTSAPASGFLITLTSDVPYTQQVDLTNQGGFYPNVINDALDKATIQIQQLNEQVSRSAKLPISSTADASTLSAAILQVSNNSTNINAVAGNATNINTVAGNSTNINTVAGISSNVTTVAGVSSNVTTVANNISAVNTNASNITAIQNASTNATNAATSATNAAASASAAASSASTASTQASNAANSAALAAAAAASGLYSAVQDKNANYTVVAADAGDLFRVTTTGGAVTITLPLISSVTDGFKVAIVKWTGDTNAVTIQRSGGDTINGATSQSIGSQYSQVTVVADFETNQWFAVTSGLGTTNVAVDVFSGNGSTTAFTLSGDPGSKNNTYVFVGGVYQQKSTYSQSGTTITFSAAPPSGSSNVEVVWTQPLAIGVPSDGTVTTAKIADASVTAAKLASGAAASNIGYTPANVNAAQSFSGGQRGSVVALTDGATITPDFAAGNNFSVTLGGNRTLANPTNQVAGQSGIITITQDGTGSRTLAFGSNWKFASGTAPTLTTTASAVDVLAYYVESATRITARLIGDSK